MDSASLAELVHVVGSTHHDSLLVVRHGHIVVEAYYAPYTSGIPHDLRSVTKSVIGTLVAIALRNNQLGPTDQPVVEFFPEMTLANLDDRKRAMTVQNLLDMTSGFCWRERAYTPDETIMQMYRSPNPVEFILNQPMCNSPGRAFYYNSGNPYLLSAIINRKTDKNASEFAQAELFGPLGIRNAKWDRIDAQGIVDGESGLFLTPRALARIGYLYLNDGAWEGRQIVPPGWIAGIRDGHVPATGGFNYANLWWSIPQQSVFMARGRHSQLIMVVVPLDLVVVITGAAADDAYFPELQLLGQVSKAASKSMTLPPNAAAQAKLAAAIRDAATEPPALLTELPPIAGEISGKTFRLDRNVLGVRTLALDFSTSDATWAFTLGAVGPQPNERRLSGLLGLDGRFRTSVAAYGIDAAKAHWWNDQSLTIERRVLGHGETQRWDFTFTGRRIDAHISSTDGLSEDLHGERSD